MNANVMNSNHLKQLRVVSSVLASCFILKSWTCLILDIFPVKLTKVDQGYCPMEVWIKEVDLC